MRTLEEVVRSMSTAALRDVVSFMTGAQRANDYAVRIARDELRDRGAAMTMSTQPDRRKADA